MKKLYLLLSLFLTIYANAQAPFITTWEFYADDLVLSTPLEISNTTNYTIDFGDGTILTDQTEIVSHTYENPGTYTVTISGNYNKINVDFSDKLKLKTVEQWGDTVWSTMENAFRSCSNLVINATDTPDLSLVTNMSYMFSNTDLFNQSINNWDVSHVIDMSYLFYDSIYDQPLNDWNVSSVTNMEGMFRSTKFNQPIDNWNVSNVKNMASMFASTTFFNQPLNNWNVSSVMNMDGMFIYALLFNQPLNDWNTNSVTNTSFMFCEAPAFNQPLNNWNVSNVTDTSAMFWGAFAFNQPLNDWNTSNVTQMQQMFAKSGFNQPLNNWDVSNVTNMTEMFLLNGVFNQPLNNWDVSNVSEMEAMFGAAVTFNQDLSDWDFKSSVNIDSSFSSYGFVHYSGLNTQNYDALLLKFAQLQLDNKYLKAHQMHYCDSGVRQYLIDEKGWSILGDSLAAECIGNDILGNVRLDENANGCDVADMGVSTFLVSANNTNTMFTYSASASSEGAFTMKVPEGTYSIKLLNLPEYYTAVPADSEIVFGGVGEQETLNFCLTSNETINDLNITLLPLGEARPGFETSYQLVVQNMGTQNVATATVNLSFDDALQTFVSADPAPTATTANELIFTITDLEPFQSRIIDLKTKLFEPPVVNGGEISNFSATISPNTDDFTPNDNTFNLAQAIVNSFDPNDKRVLQGEEIFESQTDGYLDYIIRFQNTGTASAIKVKVNDILSENLDWNTFQMVSSSHNCKVVIKEGNQVEFTFDNINLPHESDNEPGSHGFIAYKIKPIANLQVGDVINGNASSIYFDYNLPIITNATTTTVVEDIEPIQITATVTDVSCNGANDGSATVIVTGGLGSYTYAWSPSGGSEATATGLTAGDYTITVNDGFESEILNITITQPEAITITNQPEDVVLVQGGNTVFSVVASNVEQYQWQVTANGTDWDDIIDGGTAPSYAGATTDTMSITGLPLSFDGYKYRVRLSNGVNCYTYSAEANADINNTASTENYDNLDIKIYPNPSKSLVFVNIPDATSYANLKIRVLDINGRTLLEEPISDNLKNVDISDFESGIYIFTITSDKFRFSKYIIKE